MNRPALKRSAKIGYRLALLCLLALGYALPSSAQEVELCSSMQPCSVARPVVIGTDTTLSVVWRGRAFFDRIGDVSSDVGYFTLGDPASSEPLGMVRRPLMERISGSADGQPTAFSFSETLTVPAAISTQAAAQGARELSYVRPFSVNGIPVTGVQTLRLTDPAAPLPNTARSLPENSEVTASGLILRRLALRFDDGAPVASVSRDEALRAEAIIHYDRAGLLEAVWEVATPATTRGQPVFRRLDNVREYLGAGQQSNLRSPKLPTDQPGLYLLRLRLVHPTLEQSGTREPNDIVLRYQVSSRSTHEAQWVPHLNGARAVAATLGADTEFTWPAIATTHAYQLEFYAQPPEPDVASERPGPDRVPNRFTREPTTGLVLKSNTRSTRLSSAVLHRLEPGTTYSWRVVAVDASGRVLAASPLQTLGTEEE